MGVMVGLLIIAGLMLVVAEIVFIPGATVVGILGVLMAIAGVVVSYSTYGNTVGFLVLISTATSFGLLLYYSFRNSAWDRFALKNTISGKNNEGFLESFLVGEEGVCLSVLRPMGKAEFNKRAVEVSSLGEYIEVGTRVRIKEVSAAGIIVEQIA